MIGYKVNNEVEVAELPNKLLQESITSIQEAVDIYNKYESYANERDIQLQIDQNNVIIGYKEINGCQTKVLEIDPQNKTIETLLGEATFRRGVTRTSIEIGDIQLDGYSVKETYNVYGPLVCLMNKEEGRWIQRKSDGSLVFIPMKIAELKLSNGVTVYYNTWDFNKFSIFTAKLDPETISMESPAHKAEAIRQLVEAYKNEGLEDLPSDVKEQLDNIAETGKFPSCLKGYEIHHDGYGNMLFLPNDIHCRKLSHYGGSWFMNMEKYGFSEQEKIFKEIQPTINSILTEPNFSKCQDIISNIWSKTQLDNYERFNVSQRKDYIKDIGEQILHEYKLNDLSIMFTDLNGTLGKLDYDNQNIKINQTLLEQQDLATILHTMLHEIRHAIQWEVVTKPEKFDFDKPIIQSWLDNLNSYIMPSLDLEAYAKQPIEKDAEIWATLLLNPSIIYINA